MSSTTVSLNPIVHIAGTVSGTARAASRAVSYMMGGGGGGKTRSGATAAEGYGEYEGSVSGDQRDERDEVDSGVTDVPPTLSEGNEGSDRGAESDDPDAVEQVVVANAPAKQQQQQARTNAPAKPPQAGAASSAAVIDHNALALVEMLQATAKGCLMQDIQDALEAVSRKHAAAASGAPAQSVPRQSASFVVPSVAPSVMMPAPQEQQSSPQEQQRQSVSAVTAPQEERTHEKASRGTAAPKLQRTGARYSLYKHTRMTGDQIRAARAKGEVPAVYRMLAHLEVPECVRELAEASCDPRVFNCVVKAFMMQDVSTEFARRVNAAIQAGGLLLHFIGEPSPDDEGLTPEEQASGVFEEFSRLHAEHGGSVRRGRAYSPLGALMRAHPTEDALLQEFLRLHRLCAARLEAAREAAAATASR